MSTGLRRGQESGRRHRPNRLFAGAAVIVAVALAALAQPSGAAVRASSTAPARGHVAKALGQLLTYGYNNARDGVDTADPSFAHLKAAWTRNISGGIYGQPLIDGKLVIVATELDEVYALNASTGKVAWKFSIGRASNTSIIDQAPGLSGCGDISPLGITGTPVIDGATSDIYVAGEVQTGDSWHGIKHVMVAAHFTGTKAKVLWDHQIDPPGHGTTYIIPAEQLRSGLTLSDGRVYAEFGGLDGDCGAYQGYVLSYDTAGKAFEYFKVPTSREGAIWAPDGAATSSTGELFVATGNSANGPGSPYDYGDSVIGLSPNLKIDGYFAPSDWAQRNAEDLDLGAGGPIILPNSDYVFETGKDRCGRRVLGLLAGRCEARGPGPPALQGGRVRRRPVCLRVRRRHDRHRQGQAPHVSLRAVPGRNGGRAGELREASDILGEVDRLERQPEWDAHRRRRPRVGAGHGRRRRRRPLGSLRHEHPDRQSRGGGRRASGRALCHARSGRRHDLRVEPDGRAGVQALTWLR